MVERLKPKPKTKLPKITESTLANARAVRRVDTLHHFIDKDSVFGLATPPPGVVPEGTKLAMDQYGATALWAVGGTAFGGGNGNLGYLGFVGYPLLAELSQLVEYRNVMEVWTTEATRKWIEIQSQSEDEGKEDKIQELEDAIKRLR